MIGQCLEFFFQLKVTKEVEKSRNSWSAVADPENSVGVVN